MGKPGVDLVYDDLKRAAKANGTTVDETLDNGPIVATAARHAPR